MRALFRKAVADFRSYRLQFALIVVMVLAATTALALAVTVRRGTAEPYQRAFEQANGAHIWFYGGTGDTDWTPIARMDGVTGTTGPYSFAVPVVRIAGADGRQERRELQLRGMPAALPEIGRPLVSEGRWLRDGGARELVLDRNFARRWGFGIGDRITLVTSSGPHEFEVIGLTLDVGRAPYPDWYPALAYVLPEALGSIEPSADKTRSVFAVRLADPEAVEPFTAQAYSSQPPAVLTGTDTWLEVKADVTQSNGFYSVMLGVFGVFALGAAAFVIVNAIGGRVLAQFREIGLLKAVGFTPGQVILLFLLEHLALALVAIVLGLGVAALLAPRFVDGTAEVFNTTATSAFEPAVALIVVAGVAGAVGLCTLLPAWRAGRIPIVQAITVGFTRVQRRPSRLARLATWLRLPVPVVLGVKDAFARPVRAWLTMAALSLTVVTATFSIGMEATLRDARDDPGLFADPFQLDVTRGDRPVDEMHALLASVPGVAVVYERSELSARLPGRADSAVVRAVEQPHDQMGYRIREGRMFAAPGEAVVGQGLLATLGLKLGDEANLLIDGQPLTLRIVGRYVDSFEDGRTAIMSLETLRQQLRPDWLPSTYGLRLVPGADPAAVRAAIIAAAPPGRTDPGEPLEVEVFEDGSSGPITIVRGILLGLNGVLLLIGLVNLLTTALLGVRERVRDVGIFKTIGLTPGQVVTTVLASTGLLAMLGALAGIPLGLVVTRLLIDQLGRQTDVGTDIGVMPPAGLLLLLVPATVLLAVVASWLPARLAARVPVAEALRYE